MSKNTKPNQTKPNPTQAPSSNQKVKELKLSDITTLTDEKIFQARLKKMIKKAQKDEAYLKYLKDKPIEAMNEAELQPIAGLKLKVVSGLEENIIDDGAFVLLLPKKENLKNVDLDTLSQVNGGGVLKGLLSSVGYGVISVGTGGMVPLGDAIRRSENKRNSWDDIKDDFDAKGW